MKGKKPCLFVKAACPHLSGKIYIYASNLIQYLSPSRTHNSIPFLNAFDRTKKLITTMFRTCVRIRFYTIMILYRKKDQSKQIIFNILSSLSMVPELLVWFCTLLVISHRFEYSNQLTLITLYGTWTLSLILYLVCNFT